MHSMKVTAKKSKSKHKIRENRKQVKSSISMECNNSTKQKKNNDLSQVRIPPRLPPHHQQVQAQQCELRKGINTDINRGDEENPSKTTITTNSPLINGHGGYETKENKIVLTDAQKQNVERVLKKLFSTKVSSLHQSDEQQDTSASSHSSLLKSKPNTSKDKGVSTQIKNRNLTSLLFNRCNNAIKEAINQPKINERNENPFVNRSLLNEVCNGRHLQSNGDDDDNSDEEEYVEYVFKPRQYFLFSICQLCKKKLKGMGLPCRSCFMTYYCCIQHMADDKSHHTLCSVLKNLAETQGGHIFNGTGNLSGDSFRKFRIEMLGKCEKILQRNLELFEKEIILYPKLCSNESCKEWRHNYLTLCKKCWQVAYCKDDPSHLDKCHNQWCSSYSVMEQLIRLQGIHGFIEPDMPTEILQTVPKCQMTMKAIIDLLYKGNEITDDISFANATQVASAPLTAWYGTKVLEKYHQDTLNIHVVGAEFNFEAHVMQKWEYFLLHLIPPIKKLNIIFIGPELTLPGISFDLLSKSRMCKVCRKEDRKVYFKFENSFYHDYCKSSSFIKPNLVCFFNPGLHRVTGFDSFDTWPETIRICATTNCPIVVTSYTEYESLLDLKRFLMEAERPIEIILPPIINPFSSTKPERNFISDEIVPLIFKNFYCFIIQ